MLTNICFVRVAAVNGEIGRYGCARGVVGDKPDASLEAL